MTRPAPAPRNPGPASTGRTARRARGARARALGFLLAWLCLLGTALALLLGEPRVSMARKDTERFRVSAADPAALFDLDPEEERVRLLFWTSAPARWARDVRAWAAFQVRLTVLDPDGQVVWRGEAWRRSRASWIRRVDGVLLRTAWLQRSRQEVTDVRVSEVDVAGLVPRGGRLSVEARSNQAGATVWVTAYRHGWRTRAERLRAQAAGGGARGDRLADALGAERWIDLPEDWRERISSREWERLSPQPAPDGRMPRSTLLVHATPTHGWQAQPALGMPIPPGGAAAFNLQKGAVFRASWRDLAGRKAQAAPTWLHLVRTDGSSEVRYLGVVEEIGPLRAEEELQSLQLALDPEAATGRTLQAHLGGPAPPEALRWGDAPYARIEGDERVLLAPDLRSLELVRTGGALTPVRFPVHGDQEQLRLTLRPRLAPGPLPGFGVFWDPTEGRARDVPRTLDEPLRVRVRALGASEEELAAWEVEVPAVPSPFERYTQGDDPGTARASEATTRVILPPAGTTLLEVDAPALVDLALRARQPANPGEGLARRYELPAGLRPPEPEDEPDPALWQGGQLRQGDRLARTRYVPLAQDPWQARAPLERDRLSREDRMIRMDAQVRIEPRGGWLLQDAPLSVDAQTPRPAERATRRALALSGPYQLIVEPDRDGAAALGARAAIDRQPSTVVVPASGRLDVDYRTSGAAVGGEAVFEVDGETVRLPLPASAGRLRLVGLSPGPRRIRTSTDGLFLARSTGSQLWQVRRVVRLRPGERRTIAIPAGAQSLVVYTYGAPGWLHWALQGGAISPEPALIRRSTRAEGRHPLRPDGGEAWPLSMGGGVLASLSPLLIEIDADRGAAPGQLELRLDEQSPPVWLRLTSSWARPAAPTARRTRLVQR